MIKYDRKNLVYVGFMDLEKACGRVNREFQYFGCVLDGLGTEEAVS